MKERIVNKLVRDYIPDIIQEQGQIPVFRTLDDQEYAQCLEQKLREEVGEFLQEKNLDELGDILEVLEELAHLQGWTDGEIRHTREEKAQTTGLFRERVFLKKVIEEWGPWKPRSAPAKSWLPPSRRRWSTPLWTRSPSPRL